MTTSLNTEVTPLVKYILTLIKDEWETASKLEKIRREMKIYKKEISQIQDKLHTKKDGTIVLLSEVTDDHLILIVRMYLKDWYEIGDIPSKYLDEVKSRGLVTKVLDMEENLRKSEDLDEAENI